MDLNKWAAKYKVDAYIDQIRDKLKKSDFIQTIENIMKTRGHDDLWDYSEISSNTLSTILNFDNSDNILHLYALYFIIDVVNLNSNFVNPKLDMIDTFYPIAKLTIDDCNIVSAAWMLENGYPVDECLSKKGKKTPANLRIYFLRQIINRNEFNEAYNFYSNNNIPLPYSSDGKLIVTCLTAAKKLDEALEFIHQYCSPNGINFIDSHGDYIKELCRVAQILHFEDEVKKLNFNLQENLIVKNCMGNEKPVLDSFGENDSDDDDIFD